MMNDDIIKPLLKSLVVLGLVTVFSLYLSGFIISYYAKKTLSIPITEQEKINFISSKSYIHPVPEK